MKLQKLLIIIVTLCLIMTSCQSVKQKEEPIKDSKPNVSEKKTLEAAEGSGVFIPWNEYVIYAKSNSNKGPTQLIKYNPVQNEIVAQITEEKGVLYLSQWKNRILATVADLIYKENIDKTYFVLEPKTLKLVPYTLMESQEYAGDLTFYDENILLISEHVDYLTEKELSYDIYVIEKEKNVLLTENCDWYGMANGQLMYKDHNNNLTVIDLGEKTKSNVYALGQNFYSAYKYNDFLFIDTDKGMELIKDGKRSILDEGSARKKTISMLQHKEKIYYFSSSSLNEINLETLEIKPIISTKEGKSLDLIDGHIYYTDLDSDTGELKYFKIKLDGTEQDIL